MCVFVSECQCVCVCVLAKVRVYYKQAEGEVDRHLIRGYTLRSIMAAAAAMLASQSLPT